MNLANLAVDVYQLTTLVAHARLGRLDHRIAMAFFFRKMPPQRNYVVLAGVPHILGWCAELGFDGEDLELMRRHAVLGPLLAAEPQVADVLRSLRGFEGEIDAPPEGTLCFAGPGRTTAGEPLVVAGAALPLYTPLLQVKTDLVRAKLLETPWLSRLNHMGMVASKASRIVTAAAGMPVLEFGQRRTHPDAAVDAAYAAYLAGCAATSNLAASARHGIPSTGTMDHFAVQASERDGIPPAQTEAELFETFVSLMPDGNALLVDTYDTEAGLRAAARAGGRRLNAVRLDSRVTPELVSRARAILDAEDAPQAKVFVSDSLDEWRVRELAAAGADGFGVGENITCAPDAATGIGAVGKIVENGYGRRTMKFSRGSGKATLPGSLQVWRFADHDLVGLEDEAAPSGGTALLAPAWRGRGPVEPRPSLEAGRAHVRAQIEALPPHRRGLETVHGRPWPLVASDRLVNLVRARAREAGL